jgi:hypothetical protein
MLGQLLTKMQKLKLKIMLPLQEKFLVDLLKLTILQQFIPHIFMVIAVYTLDLQWEQRAYQ